MYGFGRLWKNLIKEDSSGIMGDERCGFERLRKNSIK